MIDEWVNFFAEAHARGIRWLHTSDEYSSYALLCECLSTLRIRNPDVKFRFVVKLANPGFDDATFNKGLFQSRIQRYLQHLGTEQIDVVQWMWRTKEENDIIRVNRFREAMPILESSFTSVIKQGVASRVWCFPYSPAFAHAALELPSIGGLVVYRNIQETEYDSALDECARCGKSAIAIRPFAAGKTLGVTSLTPRDLVRFSLDHPAVSSVIVGASSIAHIQDFISPVSE